MRSLEKCSTLIRATMAGLVVLVLACAPAATPTPAPAQPTSPPPAATAAPAGPAAPAATTAPGQPAATAPATGDSAQVGQLVEAAKQEGELSIYTSIFETQESIDAHTKAFKEMYDLPESFKVTFNVKNTSVATTGVIGEEIRANKLGADVVTTPALPWFLDMANQGHLMAYDSPQYAQFEVPEKLGFNNRPYFVSDMYTFLPVWNTNRLPNFEIKSWKDLLNPELKGKMVMLNGAESQSVTTSYIAIKNVVGAEFWQQLAEQQDVQIVTSSLQALDMVVSGERPLLVFGVSADPYVVRQRGVDFIRTAVPEEGIVVEPMPTAIFAQAQHPNAAKLWIEFLRSHEGQIVFSTYEGRSPGRSGVPSPDPNSIPAADTIKGLPVDLRAIAQDTALIQQSQAEFRSLFFR